MSNTKFTKRDRYIQLMSLNEVAANEELINFIKHEIELLDRKNGTRKPTATQLENENIKTHILEVMGANPVTVSEVIKALSAKNYGDYQTQKITALMRILISENKVSRIVDKRTAKFVKR